MNRLFPFIAALLATSLASAYMVPGSAPLDEMIKQADVVCKVTAISSEKVKDDSFRTLPGWAVFSTRLKLISAVKGEPPKEIEFRHYAKDPDWQGAYMYSPQQYHFDADTHYIIFAKQTKAAGVYRPLWDNHRAREDQGQLIAADDKAIAQNDVNSAIWTELAKMTSSDDPQRIAYAIRQLSSMSGAANSYDATSDFPRIDVLKLIAPLIAHKEQEAASAAIAAIAGASPYRSESDMGWLATIGKGKLLGRGHGTYPSNLSNTEAKAELARLLDVANKGTTSDLRAEAIRALGLVRDPSLPDHLRRWSSDAVPEVRAAAATLWSDFPGPDAERELSRLAGDQEVAVRRSVAGAVGYAQSTQLLSVLTVLLKDKDERVRGIAATSLVSFDPKDAADILKAFKDDPDYHAGFINALAMDDPKPYLDDLAEIVVKNLEPKIYFAAQMPVYTSWQILKAEMESRSKADLAGGKLDKYLDALDQPPNTGSGPFQEMYRMYREKGLSTRATQFRAKAKKRVTGYDIDYYFKQIDAAP